MKCNPLRWLLGLLPLTFSGGSAFWGRSQRIEDELAQRAAKHLDRNGLRMGQRRLQGPRRSDWRPCRRGERAAPPGNRGRQGLGRPRARGSHRGARKLIKNYVWKATLGNGDVALTGYVPNEAARKAILASARSAFPKHKVDDKMELARGAPEQKTGSAAPSSRCGNSQR